MKQKIEIYIDSYENMRHFNSKLPAESKGFCVINRNAEVVGDDIEVEAIVKIAGVKALVSAHSADSQFRFERVVA